MYIWTKYIYVQWTNKIDVNTDGKDVKRLYICRLYIYGVAATGRIDKMISRFCKRALYKRQYYAKETYNLIDPTDRSHPIVYMYKVYIYIQWTHRRD